MERTFYVIEVTARSGEYVADYVAVDEYGRLFEEREGVLSCVRDEIFGDTLGQLTSLRITQVDWDVPPQDVTGEFMAEIAREWAEKEWPCRRILSDYGYDDFAEQLAREADGDRAHIRAELAKRT